MFNFQKDGAILVAGIAIGLAGSSMIGGAIRSAWRVSPWSAESKLEKTRDQLADVTGKWRAEEAARIARDLAIADRDKRLLNLGAEAAVDQADAAARWGQQCQAAYQSGVAFGRALSRPSTSPGAPHAPTPPRTPAAPVAGSVRPSFRDGWSAGAFRPSAAAPAGRVPGAGGG